MGVYKTLVDKETSEFVTLIKIGDKYELGTSDIPTLQPLTATIKDMEELMKVDLSGCEMIRVKINLFF